MAKSCGGLQSESAERLMGHRLSSVVTTSDCGLSEDPDAYLQIAPLTFAVDGVAHDDHWDDEARRVLSVRRAKLTTAAPTPASFLRGIERSAGRHVIILPTGSRFSSAAAVAMRACECLDQPSSDREVFLIDSRTAGPGLSLLVRNAVAAARNGASVREIYRGIGRATPTIHIVGWVQETASLLGSGRLGRLAGVIGTRVGVSPIFALSNGRIRLVTLTEQPPSAIEHMAAVLSQKKHRPGSQACVHHVDALPLAAALGDRLSCGGFASVSIQEATPAVGVHLGRGAVVAAVMALPSDELWRD